MRKYILYMINKETGYRLMTDNANNKEKMFFLRWKTSKRLSPA